MNPAKSLDSFTVWCRRTGSNKRSVRSIRYLPSKHQWIHTKCPTSFTACNHVCIRLLENVKGPNKQNPELTESVTYLSNGGGWMKWDLWTFLYGYSTHAGHILVVTLHSHKAGLTVRQTSEMSQWVRLVLLVFFSARIIDFHQPTGPGDTHPRLFGWV